MEEVSIIIPAYKEKNVSILVEDILRETLTSYKLKEIVVVGKTNNLKKSKKVILINEKVRRGKAAAINAALKKINSDIVILISGDVVLKRGSLNYLLDPFKDRKIGMVTGRPIPLNKKNNFIGFLNHLIWCLYHLISLEHPKSCEIVAVRKEINQLPVKIAADEAYLESQILKRGYKIAYSPKSVVYDYAPKYISDLIRQRRRIFCGHLHIMQTYNYSVSTLSTIRILKALLKYIRKYRIGGFREILWLMGSILIELCARFLGGIDFYLLRKVPYKWYIIRKY